MRSREVRDKLPERLARAKELLLDGASVKEASRTTGLDRSTIQKYFPGMGWTSKQAGDFRALTRYAGETTTRRTA